MKVATKGDWKTVELSGNIQEYPLDRSFPTNDSELLQQGFIPKTINDRWFIYSENNKIYIHNSWSGTCRYVISFCKKRKKIVLTSFTTGKISQKELPHERKAINHIIDTVLLHHSSMMEKAV